MTTTPKTVGKITWNIFRPQSKRTLDEVGNPEEIISNPINHCVQGFSKDTTCPRQEK